jgi:hypothetical protein
MKRALVLLLAACGGSDHHTTDAAPIDGIGDALPTSGDGAPGGVQLHVTQGGQPVAQVATFFLGADDRVVAAVQTNGAGIAAAMLTGGTVTAVLHEGSGLERLWTFTDVQPGDMLELALDPIGPPTDANVTLSAPASSAAYNYGLFSGCGDRANSLDGTFVFTPHGCNGTADFVVTANDDLDVPQSALIAQNVSLTGSPALAGTYLPVVIPAFSYSSVDSTVMSLDTRVQLLGIHGVLYAADDAQPASNGAVTTHVRLPDTTGQGMSADVVTQLFPAATEIGQQTIHDVVDPSAPYSLGLAAAMLPRYTSAPTYDVASRTLSWGEAPSSTEATLVRTTFHAYRDAIPSGRSWSWQIVAAKTATHVTFPALPALDGFNFVPAAGDTVGVDELTTANLPYAALRTYAFAAPAGAFTSGRVVIETLYSPPM